MRTFSLFRRSLFQRPLFTRSVFKRSWLKQLSTVLVLAATLCAAGAHAQTLRIGLAEDPDVLDPTLARSFVGRIVFASLCDKLFDIDEKLNIVPQLATSYQWTPDNKGLILKLRSGVTFHDGEKFDAAAVKFNIERHKTLPGSNRRGELSPVTSVDVIDPLTVRINLSAPFAPLLSVLADRAGMMVSPKAAKANPSNFGTNPVCSGPFRFTERVAQDHITLSRYADYWNKDAIHFDKIIFVPIPDSTSGEFALGPARPDRARFAFGHRRTEERRPLQDRAHDRNRL